MTMQYLLFIFINKKTNHMKALKILILFMGLISTSFAQIVNHYYDLKTPTDWHLSSVPLKQTDIFPESFLQNDLAIGFNRAKICWYSIDPLFVNFSVLLPPGIGAVQQQNHLVRPVPFNEVYPNSPDTNMATILNLAYYPVEKGQYNFDVAPSLYSSGIDNDGNLNSPELRWGGIMRKITKNIFTDNNLNYLGFWLMDPFVYDTLSNGGNLYINLGNVSEDVLKDGRRSYESGLPASSIIANVDSTIWGRVSTLNILTDFFAGDSSLQYQDIGFDGLRDDQEQTFFQNYLNSIAIYFGSSTQAFANALIDPCSDNYHYFRGTDYDNMLLGILDRYKKINSLEGNTGVFSMPEAYPTGITTIPDDEDINGNNVLDTAENYYQYKIALNPDSLIVGRNFITDKRTINPSNGDGTPVTWYKLLIPLNTNRRKVIGNINSLDSSGFVRLFLKDFSKTVNLRFFELAFVSSDLTAIDEFQNVSEITVFPNPCKGVVNIDNSNYEINSIKVFDLTGRVLYYRDKIKDTSKTAIVLSGLNAGLYFLEIGSQNNVFIKRIIIEK